MCVRTRFIKNPKYLPSKKNNFNPPKCTDKRLLYVPVSCGRCIECRAKKKREWIIRICEEIKSNHDKALFITLTFAPEHLDKLRNESIDKSDNGVAKLGVRRWLELIRSYKKTSIKHWCVTELGEEGRIHVHGITWGATEEDIRRWRYGFVYIGKYVNEKTAAYITKYMLKINYADKDFVPKVLCSAKIGIGYMYNDNAIQRNMYNEKGTNEAYRMRNGQKIALPDYYRKKIYTDEERERLWIEKQELGYRWIRGQKVSVDDEEEYNKLMRQAQAEDERIRRQSEEEWEAEREKKRLKRMREYVRNYRKSVKKGVNK